jgi:mono/diheme cytochrome c family protein
MKTPMVTMMKMKQLRSRAKRRLAAMSVLIVVVVLSNNLPAISGYATAANIQRTPDLGNGAKVFEENCLTCHNFEQDGIGPQLGGLQGAVAADYLIKFIGKYLFGEIVRGRVFAIDLKEVKEGSQATIREYPLTLDGRPLVFQQQSNVSRIDLRIGRDAAGELYLMTKSDGMLYRIVR